MIFILLKINKYCISTSLSVAQPGSASGLGPEGRRFDPATPTICYEKAKIYRPNKSAMQSGLGKSDKWILEFETKDQQKSFNGLGEFIRHIYRT